jgi:hypothetical protein
MTPDANTIAQKKAILRRNNRPTVSIYNLGLALHLDQRYEDALHCSERAITIQPN